MGSTYGTHCLGRARMEPIAPRWVGRSSRSRSSAGQDKGTGPTSCTDLAVRQLLVGQDLARGPADRSEEHTSELQSLMRHSYAVFCLKKIHKANDDSETHNPSTEQKPS